MNNNPEKKKIASILCELDFRILLFGHLFFHPFRVPGAVRGT